MSLFLVMIKRIWLAFPPITGVVGADGWLDELL